MRHENRVAWSEGMFLRVQHFQQADRWTERLVRNAVSDARPYPYGVADVVLDREALKIGRFALAAVRAVMPDGTLVEAPGDADLPPPVELQPGTRDAVIYLALATRQPGRADVALNGAAALPSVRLVSTPFEAPDANVETDFIAPIEVGRLKLRLLAAGDEMAGFERVGLARIIEVRSDMAVVLDPDYVAPATNCGTDGPLIRLLTELLGILRHRAEAVAARIGDPTVRGTAEVGDFLLLQTLNRVEPLFAHLLANARVIHPEDFYRAAVQLAGELATFTKPEKRAASFPAYRHDDLTATFEAVFADLRASLSAVLEQAAVQIPLQERRFGVRVGTINDRTLLTDTGFVLAVRADMAAETLRRSLPNQIKVGPVERIAELVNVALPGVPVRPLPVLPRQLPYRTGTVYFELDTTSPLWKQLDTSGAIALHLSGEFPGLELELWALKG